MTVEKVQYHILKDECREFRVGYDIALDCISNGKKIHVIGEIKEMDADTLVLTRCESRTDAVEPEMVIKISDIIPESTGYVYTD